MNGIDPLAKYPPYMTAAQVAGVIGISVDRLNQWRKLGRGPEYVKLGDGPNGSVRYPRESLRNYLKQRTTTPAVP